jgi:hypothetical protein
MKIGKRLHCQHQVWHKACELRVGDGMDCKEDLPQGLTRPTRAVNFWLQMVAESTSYKETASKKAYTRKTSIRMSTAGTNNAVP